MAAATSSSLVNVFHGLTPHLSHQLEDLVRRDRRQLRPTGRGAVEEGRAGLGEPAKRWDGAARRQRLTEGVVLVRRAEVEHVDQRVDARRRERVAFVWMEFDLKDVGKIVGS